jgi:hypothetical protein
MKNLSVNANNFSEIRENLKSGETVLVNNVITITGYEANTEKISHNGKKVRTPFFYILENGTKVNSTKLKAMLNIEAETKGSRKETTFNSIWEQTILLASSADLDVLKEALTELKKVIENKEAEKAALLEREKAALIEAAKKLGLVLQPKNRSRK